MATVGQDYIGPYRLLKLIRAGQSTQIWEAMNSTENRRVALKSLQKDYRQDREEINFLKHEYAVGKDLHHPNVISIQEFSIDRGVPYLVLELFNAPNLKQALRSQRDQILHHVPEIISQAAAGLAYLHRQGWIHRDIKPDNFLVDQQGHTKLIDFAIAQRERRGLARLLSGRSKIQGTRSYMSPEQIRGENLDFRSDLYSFACMVYEVVGGKLPYTGHSADDLLTKHLRSAVPSLVAVNNNVSPEFSQLVARMMAKEPDARPASMDEFLGECESLRVFRVRPKPTGDSAQQES